jgi:ADP-ribose pyrophosphatase YjhB (NUDIX family)
MQIGKRYRIILQGEMKETMIDNNFIGVGGLIFHQEKYLLVKQAYGEYKGLWILPGGHVKQGEAIHRAVEREVLEESNISAEAAGIIAARSRIRSPRITDCYLIFKMNYLDGIPRSDGREVEAADFLHYDEIDRYENVVNLTKIIIQQHRAKKLKILNRTDSYEFYNSNHPDYQLFL